MDVLGRELRNLEANVGRLKRAVDDLARTLDTVFWGVVLWFVLMALAVGITLQH